MVLNLFKNSTYLLSVLCITNVLFVIFGLVFSAVQYATKVLKADETFVLLTYSLTIVTAPCLGAIIGGLVTTKFLGSYKHDNALVLCFIVQVCFTASCIPCPFFNDYLPFLVFMWLAAFFQGFLEPIMMGIILSSVSEVERSAASSVSILLEMLFGEFPAPYLYSLVYSSTQTLDADGENVSRGGMYTIFFSSFIGLIALAVALPLRKRSIQGSEKRTRKVIIK